VYAGRNGATPVIITGSSQSGGAGGGGAGGILSTNGSPNNGRVGGNGGQGPNGNGGGIGCGGNAVIGTGGGGAGGGNNSTSCGGNGSTFYYGYWSINLGSSTLLGPGGGGGGARRPGGGGCFGGGGSGGCGGLYGGGGGGQGTTAGTSAGGQGLVVLSYSITTSTFLSAVTTGTVNRLTNSGTLYTNGVFTETGSIISVSTTGVTAHFFDEVSLVCGSIDCNAVGAGAGAGVGSYITSTPSSSAFIFPGAFTVEFYAYWPGQTGRNGTGIANMLSAEEFVGVFSNGGFCIAHSPSTGGTRISGTGGEVYVPPFTTTGTIFPAIYNITGGVDNTSPIGGYVSSFADNVRIYNQWYHIAVTRDSSNSVQMWVNGKPQGTAVTYAGTFTSGAWSAGSIGGGRIWISGMRVVSGKALYTSSFQPPNTAFYRVPGTELLMNMYNPYTYLTDISGSTNYFAFTTTFSINGTVNFINTGAYNQGRNVIGNFIAQRALPDGTLQNWILDDISLK